jgi:hypothetical protein
LAYIGVQPADAYTSFAVQHFTTSATDTFTLDFPVANENEIALFINNVRQEPGSSYAYTASGTTLTLASAITGSDSMYCVFIGKAVQTVTPAVGSVTNDMLAGSIANAKLANSSITLNGSAVSLGGSATVGVSAEPYFSATNNTPQTLTNGVTGNIVFQTEVIDSNGCFNNTGGGVTLNGIPTDANSFAPNVSGYYHLGASVHFQTVADGTSIEMMIYKNQGAVIRNMIHSGNGSKDLNPFVSLIIDANGTSDDFQVAVRLDGATDNTYYTSGYVRFWGYRII